MATNVRRNLPELVENIAADASQYDYFQIVRMLETVWGPYHAHKNPLDAKVNFRPAKEINFPAADVRRARQTDNGKLSVELNFMGLYGVDAAVPQYIITTALHEDEASQSWIPSRYFEVARFTCQRYQTPMRLPTSVALKVSVPFVAAT